MCKFLRGREGPVFIRADAPCELRLARTFRAPGRIGARVPHFSQVSYNDFFLSAKLEAASDRGPWNTTECSVVSFALALPPPLQEALWGQVRRAAPHPSRRDHPSSDHPGPQSPKFAPS